MTSRSGVYFCSVKWGAAALLAAALGACGGDETANSTAPGIAALSGQFVDGPVNGLKYLGSPSGISGITGTVNGKDGVFLVKAGDTVTFFVGNVSLGMVSAQETITLLDIANAALKNAPAGTNTEDVVKNIGSFLQTFTDSGSGKIVIPALVSVRNDLPPLNFNKPAIDFADDYKTAVNSINGKVPGLNLKPVKPEQVVEHLQQQANELLGNTWAVVDKNGNFAGDAVTFFPDGHYLFGGHDNDPGCAPDSNTNTTFANNSSGNGVEYGRFSWDLTTGAFRVRDLTVETNGTCGLNGSVDDVAKDDPRLRIDGSSLFYTVKKRADKPCEDIARLNGDRCEFKLVLAGKLGDTTLKGSWLADHSPPGRPRVIILFGDSGGRYFDMDAFGSDGATPGLEDGCFAIGANHALTASTSTAGCENFIDTNGADRGFRNSQINQSPTLRVDPNNPRRFMYRETTGSDPGDCADTDPGCTATRMPLIASGEHPPAPLKEQLLGSWTQLDKQGVPKNSNVLTFFKNGKYLFGTHENEPGCNVEGDTTANGTSNGNGVEFGGYSWNPDSGAFSVSHGNMMVETNGFCGLNEPPQASTNNNVKLRIVGDTLVFFDNDTGDCGGDFFSTTEAGFACEYHFKRVPSTPSQLIGSFLADGSLAGESPAVLTLFQGGRYFLASGNPHPNTANGESAGIEDGCLSVASDGTVTVTLTSSGTCPNAVDTNGEAGLSHPTGGSARLIVLSERKLRYVEAQANADGHSDTTLTRLPTLDDDSAPNLAPATAADLAGAWYVAKFGDGPEVPAAHNTSYIAFFGDGKYIFGGKNDDPNCDADYGNANPVQADDGPLDPDGNGSEYASWAIAGGRLTISGPALVDSNGSCGFFSTNPNDVNAPKKLVEKVNSNALKVTFYEKPSGASEYVAHVGLIKRIPSHAGTLVGAWTTPVTANGTSARELFLLFEDGTDFYLDVDEKGGIERGKHSLNEAQNTLTLITDNTVPGCVDTIGPNSSCAAGSTLTLPFAFNLDKSQFTVTENSVSTIFSRVGGP